MVSVYVHGLTCPYNRGPDAMLVRTSTGRPDLSVQREDLLEEVARAATNVIAKLPDEWFARGDKEVAELVIALDRLELNAHVTHLFDRARMEQE